MLENTIKLKTETETLAQIKEILATDPQGHDLIKIAIVEAVTKLHTKTFQDEATLLLIDESQFEISPKNEHKKFMQDLTGKKGPYKVMKTYKSWVGLSDGVYAIEDCGKFIPVSWCEKAPGTSRLTALSIFLAISSLIQSALLLALFLA